MSFKFFIELLLLYLGRFKNYPEYKRFQKFLQGQEGDRKPRIEPERKGSKSPCGDGIGGRMMSRRMVMPIEQEAEESETKRGILKKSISPKRSLKKLYSENDDKPEILTVAKQRKKSSDPLATSEKVYHTTRSTRGSIQREEVPPSSSSLKRGSAKENLKGTLKKNPKKEEFKNTKTTSAKDNENLKEIKDILRHKQFKKLEFDDWVQCESCKKWRKVSGNFFFIGK